MTERKKRNLNNKFSLLYHTDKLVIGENILQKSEQNIPLTDINISKLSGHISHGKKKDQILKFRYTLLQNPLLYGKHSKVQDPPATLDENELCHLVPLIKRLLEKRKKDAIKKEKEEQLQLQQQSKTNPVTPHYPSSLPGYVYRIKQVNEESEIPQSPDHEPHSPPLPITDITLSPTNPPQSQNPPPDTAQNPAHKTPK